MNATTMSDLSDRQHDIFDNPAKAQCRAGNLRALRESGQLLWQDAERSRPRCDWCELMGATGLLTVELLEREGVLADRCLAAWEEDERPLPEEKIAWERLCRWRWGLKLATRGGSSGLQ